MELLLFFILFALLFGLGGMFTAAKWLIIIAIIFLLLGGSTAYRSRRR